MLQLRARNNVFLKFVELTTVIVLLTHSAVPADTCGKPPNTANDKIKYVMYLSSKPQDSAQCTMEVANGKIVIKDPVSNPAMSCPDMFSWKLYTEAITQEFWKNWAADQQTWPGVACDPSDPKCKSSNPLPLCKAGGGNCCDPDSLHNPGYDDKNNPAKYCPYFPGDHVAEFPGGMPLRIGMPPSKAHLVSFEANPQIHARLMALATEEPGRKIRQSMAEIVFRNRSMFDYTFRNNLYNQEGIIQVFNNNSANIRPGAPYRKQSVPGALAEIDYPLDAVMIKSNWISKERALKIGLKDDPENPYIKMNILSPVTDNNGTILEPGEHWLVAFHVSSKDVPNWIWATFEHVDNLGRCDFTGCNDSYGYSSGDDVPAGLATNFTTPHIACDDLLLPSVVFDLGKTYPGGTRSQSLSTVFQALGIGTTDNTTLTPTPKDKGWLSYRLKGSQAQFTDSMGRTTHLGNSVTEGGFVNSSSCVSCHARAGTTGKGTLPPALSVFISQLSDSGYLESSHGIPNPDWYNRSSQPPDLTVLQTDFVWGFLTANCVTDKCQPAVLMRAMAEEETKEETKKPTVRSRTDAH